MKTRLIDELPPTLLVLSLLFTTPAIADVQSHRADLAPNLPPSGPPLVIPRTQIAVKFVYDTFGCLDQTDLASLQALVDWRRCRAIDRDRTGHIDQESGSLIRVSIDGDLLPAPGPLNLWVRRESVQFIGIDDRPIRLDD
jgi:hypothetical protein